MDRSTSRVVVAVVAVAAFAGLALTGCGSDDASFDVDQLTVTDAWALPATDGTADGVLSFRVTSPIDDELRQVEVPSDIAAAASLQGGEAMPDMSGMPGMDHSSMQMTPLSGVPLSADRTVVLRPDGDHVMLKGLAGPLEEGDTFRILVLTGSGATAEAEVVVSAEAPAD